MKIDINTAVNLLKNMDNILILAHENPDGDAVGSANALGFGLEALGKKVSVKLDSIPKRMEFAENKNQLDRYDYIVAVDTADSKILGVKNVPFDNSVKIDLCIDHHYSNVLFAKNTYLDSTAAGACEAVFDILKLLNIEITEKIAKCLYLGIATDTGCFRYSNTTAKTLRQAAELMETGIDCNEINRSQFETKSKEFITLEKTAISSLELFLNGKCAILPITYEMFTKSGVEESELSALASMPREIEGVLIGITLKEKEKGTFRVSVRTNPPASATDITEKFGGGGHKMAAGCTIKGTLDYAVTELKKICEQVLKEI